MSTAHTYIYSVYIEYIYSIYTVYTQYIYSIYIYIYVYSVYTEYVYSIYIRLYVYTHYTNKKKYYTYISRIKEKYKKRIQKIVKKNEKI